MKWAWTYYAACQLFATFFFWVPTPFVYQWFMHLFGHHFTGWAFTPPIGLTVVVLLCLCRVWNRTEFSIKPLHPDPLINRTIIDAWPDPFNYWWGNPEDGVSGFDAFGPDWYWSYNAKQTRWLAICWNCRNWFAGFNYVTWLWPDIVPPIIKKTYTVFGKRRELQLGWTQLPKSDGWVGPYTCRMVCSI